MRPVAFSRRVLLSTGAAAGCALAQRDAAAYSGGHFGSTVVSQTLSDRTQASFSAPGRFPSRQAVVIDVTRSAPRGRFDLKLDAVSVVSH